MHEITPSQPYPSAQGRRLSPPGTPKFDDTMRRSPTGAHGATRTFHRVHETGAHARATGPIAEPPSAIEQPGDRWDDDLLTTTAKTCKTETTLILIE